MIQERRVKTLEAHIASLRFDVPPPAPETTVLRKICAWQVKSGAKSAEKRLLKERQRKRQRSGDSRSLSNTEIATASTLDKTTNAKDNTSVEAAPEVKTYASSSASSEAIAIGVTSL